MIIIIFSIIIGGEFIFSIEGDSIFECGYDCEVDSRSPFSLRFFLVIILFIVFDIEILLIVPLSITNYWYSSDLFLLYLFIIIIVVYFSLIYEWIQGCLDWL